LTWAPPVSVQLYPNPGVLYDVIENGYDVANGMTSTLYTTIFLQNTTVEYQIRTTYPDGQVAMSAPFTVEIDFNADDLHSGLPTVFALYPNFPNPFNPETQIRLDVPLSTTAQLQVFDIQGRLVRTLLDGSISAGAHMLSWNGRDDAGQAVGSGVYFYRFRSAQYTASHKMLLVK
jgi:hypothetical protein